MSPCYTDGNLTLCRPGRGRTLDKGDPETRWCFICRKRTEFRTYLFVEDVPSYYDSHFYRACTVCRKQDADLFPGTGPREWDDE